MARMHQHHHSHWADAEFGALTRVYFNVGGATPPPPAAPPTPPPPPPPAAADDKITGTLHIEVDPHGEQPAVDDAIGRLKALHVGSDYAGARDAVRGALQQVPGIRDVDDRMVARIAVELIEAETGKRPGLAPKDDPWSSAFGKPESPPDPYMMNPGADPAAHAWEHHDTFTDAMDGAVQVVSAPLAFIAQLPSKLIDAATPDLEQYVHPEP